MERRERERCPECKGPAVADETRASGIRCRRSTCIFNHDDAKCPRCHSTVLESVTFQNGDYVYTCSDCSHRWSASSQQK